jgi:undecaprenyl-diphosphatase
VVVLVVVTLASRLFGGSVSEFLAELLAGLERLPAWVVTAVVVVGELLGLALVVWGGVVTVARRRWRLLGGLAVAAALSVPLTWLTRPGSEETATSVTQVQGWLGDVHLDRPSPYLLAAVVALTASVSPWTSRRVRRAWWAAALAVALAHLLPAPVSLATVLAMASGWVAGAASVVAVGAPSRRPTRAAVVDGLRSVGVDVVELEPASVDARGSTPYFGRLAAGTPVFVKTLGTDERSADLLFRLYRRVQPRDLHDERPFSSLRRTVEHEALVALMAAQVGVRTPSLVALAPASPNGFTLAYDAVAGRSLDREPDGPDLDRLVREVWAQVQVLRHARIAHRDLRLANVFVGADRCVWLIDFGFSEISADEVLLDGDVAELLASTATTIGPDRAVAAALEVVGAEALHPAVARLRAPLLSGATRTSLRARPGLLDRLVELASGEAVGTTR